MAFPNDETNDDLESTLANLDYQIDQGNPDAMFTRASYHETGKSGEVNLKAAEYLYKMALAKGHLEAKDALEKLKKKLESQVAAIKAAMLIEATFVAMAATLVSKFGVSDTDVSSQPEPHELPLKAFITNKASLANLKGTRKNTFKAAGEVYLDEPSNEEIGKASVIISRIYFPLLAFPEVANATSETITQNHAHGQDVAVLKLLDKYEFELIKTLNLSIKSPKTRLKLLSSVQTFREQAEIICRLSPMQENQDKYNEVVAEKLHKLARINFKHRHKLIRILADIVFIPLGIVTLGAAFYAKQAFTGSKTFFVDKKTKRFEKLEEISELKLGPKKGG